ncbi:MAG: GNAT family N-acetyltransferase [Alphaproteobacteria bacterium]|nr:GNAT family N-acetyltransferase [Alphaproteobacteria bacterium]MBL6938003.1 GNAT family N-acetyltransferase [Alphaproteobacteria bacterium]MBL7099172.1 GNAT family N-acetyltransferase [Alphaproteobacteria bacterium]
MATIIRSATPDDGAFLGWASVIASRSQLKRGWFEIVLRRNDTFCFEFAKCLTLAKAVSWWHWSHFLVAEVDGVVASALCGFGDDSVYSASMAAMTEAGDRMGIPRDEQAQFWPRGRFIVSPATSEDDAWTIENVATLPEYRGRGLVERLLAADLERARKAGFKRAQISFFMGNDPAERAYTKAGFAFAEQKTAPDFEAALGIPGIKRFARDI